MTLKRNLFEVRFLSAWYLFFTNLGKPQEFTRLNEEKCFRKPTYQVPHHTTTPPPKTITSWTSVVRTSKSLAQNNNESLVSHLWMSPCLSSQLPGADLMQGAFVIFKAFLVGGFKSSCKNVGPKHQHQQHYHHHHHCYHLYISYHYFSCKYSVKGRFKIPLNLWNKFTPSTPQSLFSGFLTQLLAVSCNGTLGIFWDDSLRRMPSWQVKVKAKII